TREKSDSAEPLAQQWGARIDVSRESDKAAAHHLHAGLRLFRALLLKRLADAGNRFHAIPRVKAGPGELVLDPGPPRQTPRRGQQSLALIKEPVQGAKVRRLAIE